MLNYCKKESFLSLNNILAFEFSQHRYAWFFSEKKSMTYRKLLFTLKNKIGLLIYMQFRQMLCEVICSHFRINEIYKLKTAKSL